MLRLKPLHQQVVVITGASSGIGLATARLAAQRGASLVLAGRSQNALHRLVGEISSTSRRAIAVVADVSVEADVERIAAAATNTFGGFDTWVNNAAASAYGSCTEVSIRDMRQIMETNYWGTVYGSRVACAALRQRGGALINVGSVVSDRAVPLQGAYSASKHAIKGWTDALRVELAHEQAPISVTLIKPSAINTPYAEHASNYFPDQPTHIAPVYAPRSVARAILYAAEHPTRELVVGSAGLVLTAASALAPSLVDTLMSRLLMPAMHSGRAPYGRTAVFDPSEDLTEQGTYRGVVRPSLYTALRTRPTLAATLATGGAVLAAALWTRRYMAPAQGMSSASGTLR
jgi:short-subunit dehydrogenase